MNERVKQSIDVVRKELAALPHAVRLLLTLQGTSVTVKFDLDDYQLVMAEVLQVGLV